MSAGIKTVSLDPVIKKLEESGFYWGAISAVKAKSLLREKPVGQFLVRDSSDSRHLFTITLVTATGITNVRINFTEGFFSLDRNDTFMEPRNEEDKNYSPPKFDCVVKMVFYYMLVSTGILQAKEKVTKTLGNRGTPKFTLWSPLYKEVSSLQHLCRRALNRQILATGGTDVKQTSIPHPVKSYLSQYPYPM